MIFIKELLINGIDYSEFATIPLQEQRTLDESLDVSYIELKGIENENPFTPFSDILLKIVDDFKNEKSFSLFLESDDVTQIISLNKYNHNILMIEQTKWLERFFVEKSTTRPLIHDYLKGASSVYVTVDNEMFWFIPSGSYQVNFTAIKSPVLVNSNVQILRPYFLMKEIEKQASVSSSITNVKLKIISPSGKTSKYSDGWSSIPNERTFNYNFDEVGDYKFLIDADSSLGTMSSSGQFVVTSISQKMKKTNKTIKDVINILLETCETIRESEMPKFKLAEIQDYNKSENYINQIRKIFEMESPDFYFSKMSLFEALKTIGDYCHFIPRMENKKIYLDLLGTDEYINEKLEDYYSSLSNQSTNDFCTKLDSQVNNFINLDNERQGSVVTPFNDGWRTLRAEEGQVVITDDNIIIPTESPIEKIIKLEIGYLKNGQLVGDITPYVYESAEYEALSSYDSEFPNSKMYAIKYTQGSKNITGLTFERKNVISQAFEGIAIKNIIYRKLNRDINWWNNLWDNEDVFKLQYRLTYIPNTSTRVTQSKTYKDNITKTISIAYNQSASKISSSAYGENLKGQVLKLGNIEKTKMYLFDRLDLIPVCGQKFDKDYYISIVKTEYYPNFIKCELGLSKDYNNKSAYVEINSEIRFYEISEKTAYDIYRIYEDYCEIGFDNETDNKSLITNDGIDKFANAFEKTKYSENNITMVKANGIDEYGVSREFTLPVTSLAVGNSILLEYHYEDNFSAGVSATYDTNKIQQLERYTDEYGEIKSLELKYGENITKVTSQSEAVAMGNKLPKFNVQMKTYLDTQGDNIKLLKDNREIIHFSYQMHFVANNNRLIIGSGLASYCPFVTNEMNNYKMYILNKRLNKFENEIDLTNAVQCDSILISKDYEKCKFKIENVIAPENGKSWVIVQENNNIAVMILGENIDINKNDIIEMPNFVFKHKIVED